MGGRLHKSGSGVLWWSFEEQIRVITFCNNCAMTFPQKPSLGGRDCCQTVGAREGMQQWSIRQLHMHTWERLEYETGPYRVLP